MEPLLIPVPDACRAIGISRSTLYELISSGAISIRKIGRKTLIPREDLTSFAARLTASKGKREAA